MLVVLGKVGNTGSTSLSTSNFQGTTQQQPPCRNLSIFDICQSANTKPIHNNHKCTQSIAISKQSNSNLQHTTLIKHNKQHVDNQYTATIYRRHRRKRETENSRQKQTLHQELLQQEELHFLNKQSKHCSTADIIDVKLDILVDMDGYIASR